MVGATAAVLDMPARSPYEQDWVQDRTAATRWLRSGPGAISSLRKVRLSAQCFRPALAAAAVAQARVHFGDEEYEQRKAQAATRSTPEIEQYLLDVCAELGR